MARPGVALRGLPRLLAEMAALAVLAALGGAMTVATGWPSPLPPYDPAFRERAALTPAAAISLRGALFLDARPAGEFKAARLPGALSLDPAHWDEHLLALSLAWDGQRPLVLYCGSNGCALSRELATRLRRDLGTDRVFYLEGGWEAWRARGGPVETTPLPAP